MFISNNVKNISSPADNALLNALEAKWPNVTIKSVSYYDMGHKESYYIVYGKERALLANVCELIKYIPDYYPLYVWVERDRISIAWDGVILDITYSLKSDKLKVVFYTYIYRYCKLYLSDRIKIHATAKSAARVIHSFFD